MTDSISSSDKNDGLKRLAQPETRTAILLSEIGGLLHMIGKLSSKFVQSKQVATNISYEYKDFDQEADWQTIHLRFIDLLKDETLGAKLKISQPSNFTNAPKCLLDFCKKHAIRNNSEPLFQLLADAHGLGSGTEKGSLPDYEGKQKESPDSALANVFGYEKLYDLTNLDKSREELLPLLEKQLTRIRDNSMNDPISSLNEWIDILTNSKEGIYATIRKAFSKAWGDTRRPTNEVTLWDQTFITATLLKTSLVGWVIRNTWEDLLKVPFERKARWRILRLYYGGLSFIEQAAKMRDLKARWQLLEELTFQIKNYLEIELPLGVLIYQDEQGMAFVVPDIDNLLALETINGSTLYQKLQTFSDETFLGEWGLTVELSEPSRGAVNLGRLLAQPTFVALGNEKILGTFWQKSSDKCRTCQSRPIGSGAERVSKYQDKVAYYSEKSSKRNMCCICLARADGTVEKWLDKKILKSSTIWLDEVADTNGRLVLLAAQFDLAHWQAGQLSASLLGRLAPFDAKAISFDKGLNPFAKIDEVSYASLKSSITNELSERDIEKKTPVIEALLKHTNVKATTVEEVYKALVEERDNTENAPRFDQRVPERAEFLLQAILGKTSSFARLRRMWETAEEFWQKQELDNSVGKVQDRLELTGFSEDLHPTYSYDVKLKNVKISLVYDDQPNKRLLMVDNLAYVAKLLGRAENNNQTPAEFVADQLRQQAHAGLRLEGEGGGESTITGYTVEVVAHNYLPAIPILSEPNMFMAVVPGDKALEVAKQIKNAYETEFSKVQNRLPLQLNLVFFDRRTPLYAVIDTARRMLDRKTPTEIYTVKDKHNLPTNKAVVQLCRKDTENGDIMSEKLSVEVSYRLGDGSADFYYPYFFANQANVGITDFGSRPHHFKATLPSKGEKDMVHVSELESGDEVYFMPSTFDFEYLDVTARRFEMNYHQKGGRLGSSTRPFLLQDIDHFEQLWECLGDKLTNTQLKQISGLLAEKRRLWTKFLSSDAAETLKDFAHQSFARAFKEPKFDNELLLEWAVNGRLDDLLELYTEIMKQDTEKTKKLKVQASKLGEQ